MRSLGAEVLRVLSNYIYVSVHALTVFTREMEP
jgi:hypothetical protein